MRELVAYSTMAVAMGLAVTRPRLRGRWHIGPAPPAALGVVILLGAGIVHLSEVKLAAIELWQPLVTIVSIMVMTAAAHSVGALERLGAMIFSRRDASPQQLFFLVFFLSALTSSVLNNDAMVLLLTPLVIRLVRARYPENPEILVPFAFVVFTAVGVAPFVVSNPINMIVAAYARLDYNQYALLMCPIAVAGWIVAFLVLRLLFARALALPLAPPPTSSDPARLSGTQWRMLLVLAGVLAVYPVVASYDGPSIWIVAVTGAVLALGLAWKAEGINPLRLVVKGVSWDILIFLVSVFILAVGLRNVGLADKLALLYTGSSVWLIGFISALGSAVINNHSMAILNVLALEATPDARRLDVMAVLVGGDLGPRLLPIGSLAGLLWLDACRRMSVRIPLRQFIQVGFAVTVPTLIVSLFILSLR